MSESKLYGKRDVRSMGLRYMAHVTAMTVEKLNKKSDIAAELAYRDILIAEAAERLSMHIRQIRGEGFSDLMRKLWAVSDLPKGE